MDNFIMNGIRWAIILVPSNSPLLDDRTGAHTVACTDPVTKRVYLDVALRGDFLRRVLRHELGHCALVSYDLLDYIHTMVKPQYWIDAEEFMCNLIADYGLEIDQISDNYARVELNNQYGGYLHHGE